MKSNFENESAETQLIELAKNGDKEAFCVLAERNQNMVFQALRKMVSDAPLAEDLTQEVFIKAFKGISNFKSQAKFSTWLMRITINTGTNYYKSKAYKDKKETVKNSEDFFKILSAPKENEAEYQARLKIIKIKLQELKPIYSEVVSLYSFGGQSYKEISDSLEIPLGTVKSRMNMAINILRKELGGQE